MKSLNSLPDEIVSDILLRLPVKCLIRCTAVCKPWKARIKSSKFIHTHLNRTIEAYNEQGSRLLLHHGRLKPKFSPFIDYDEKLYEQERYSLHYDDRGFDEYCEVDFQIDRMVKRYNSHFRVAGVCNGVICLADDIMSKMYSYILWNPAIRKAVQLPSPFVTFTSHGPFDDTIGFGFDVLTDDYKVVRLVTVEHNFCDNEDEDVLIPTLAEVYSLATGAWRSVGDIASCCEVRSEVDNIFFNGAIHWALQRCDDRCTFILTFVVGSEVFGEISMPESIKSDQFLSSKVSVTGDGKSLALFTTSKENRNNFDFFQGDSDYFLDIWAMNEYGVQESWTRMMRLDKQTGIPRPLCFRQGSELFLLKCRGFSTDEALLVSLDLVSRKVSSQEHCGKKFVTLSILMKRALFYSTSTMHFLTEL